MRNIALKVAYDGTSYHGWQCQPGRATVQETLAQALSAILNHPTVLYGAGRTDSGVHALGQVVNFHTAKTIPLSGLVRGTNSLLPRDIRVQDAVEEDGSFHSRYSAKSKRYMYCIMNRTVQLPFFERYTWQVPYVLDVRAMDRALRCIEGEHDFSSFKKKSEMYTSAVRKVILARVRRKGPMIVVFIEATGFLRYMVRNIVGTLVLVGEGRLSGDRFAAVLGFRDRDKAGPTAPARGLFLLRITY